MKSVGTKPTRAFNDDVVHEVHVRGLTMNDTNDVVPNTDAGDNDRGYSTPDRFAPDRRHSSDKAAGGPTREFKAMVKAYHDAGTAMNRIVAEPWAIGSGTYQLGNFPSGWSGWNGSYRDLVREAQNKLSSVTVTTGHNSWDRGGVATAQRQATTPATTRSRGASTAASWATPPPRSTSATRVGAAR